MLPGLKRLDHPDAQDPWPRWHDATFDSLPHAVHPNGEAVGCCVSAVDMGTRWMMGRGSNMMSFCTCFHEEGNSITLVQPVVTTNVCFNPGTCLF